MSTIFLCSEPIANHIIVFYFFGFTCEQETQLAVPVKNEMKQQGDGDGEHLKNDKLRVAGHGLGNTRARRTNTANHLVEFSHQPVPAH